MFKLTITKCDVELKEVSQYVDQNTTQQYSKHDSLLRCYVTRPLTATMKQHEWVVSHTSANT